MKLFARTVDSVKPTVELRQNDSQGSIIQPGGAGGGKIYVKAFDPGGTDPGGDPAWPTPSGIYKLELKRVSTGDAIAANPAIAAAGENPATRTYSNLAEGEYELKAIDGLGNNTSVRFHGNHS